MVIFLPKQCFRRISFLRAVWIVLLLSSPGYLCGCDAIYRMLQKEGAEEREILGEIVPFERNERVAEVQALLKLYGYTVGHVDGALGNNTRNAISAFQEDNGIKVSRFVDTKTWQKLHIFDEYGLVINGELNIAGIQAVLKAIGYEPGPVDGKRGRKTDQAIIDFQKNHKLKSDGKVGWVTLSTLSQYISLTGE